MRKRLYIALLHSPVYNKGYEVITTSVTNLDVHDISRAARTYGVKRYFLVHPQETQRQLVEEMIRYWVTGFGSEYNRTARKPSNYWNWLRTSRRHRGELKNWRANCAYRGN